MKLKRKSLNSRLELNTLPGHRAWRAIHIHGTSAYKTDSGVYVSSHVIEKVAVYFAGRGYVECLRRVTEAVQQKESALLMSSYSNLEEAKHILCMPDLV